GGGLVSCWGFANGLFTATSGDGLSSNAPVAIAGISAARAVAVHQSAAYALLTDGTVVAWGGNALGELGDGGTTPRATPAPVPGLTGVDELVAAGNTACARSGGL